MGLRGLGGAFPPGILQVARALPPLAFMAFAVPLVWMMAAGMAATSRTLRISSSRSMIAILAAWGAWGIVGFVAMVILGLWPSFTT